MKTSLIVGLYCVPVALLAFVMGRDLAAESEMPPLERYEPSFIRADRVEAREIVLRDEQGRTRATLGVDGGDVLRFTASSSSHENFCLSVFPDGRGALLFKDKSGVNRIALSIREDGRPVVTLGQDANVIFHDSRGRNRVVLGAPEEGEPHLTLYNNDLKATIVRPGQIVP